jgi:hypothetical protein
VGVAACRGELSLFRSFEVSKSSGSLDLELWLWYT